MERQAFHPMLVNEVHDEFARELFSTDLAKHISQNIAPATKNIFHKYFPDETHSSKNKILKQSSVRKQLLKDPIYQTWSSLKRTTQEILFDTVGEVVARQTEELREQAKKIRTRPSSLQLNASLTIPHYISSVDIHCMPGGYTTELMANDFSAGALFDRGVFLYGRGGLGGKNDDIGQSSCHWLKKKYPTFRPDSILDMGCGIGSNTLPYAHSFPGSKVFAIDLSASLLRYGSARANYWDNDILFSQQNAERTNFEENSFDLIVSHLFTHETSLRAFKNIVGECFRLLRKNGMMVHVETDWNTKNNPYNKSALDWETHFNAEPFKTTLENLDKKSIAVAAGFLDERIFFDYAPSQKIGSQYYAGRWVFFGASS